MLKTISMLLLLAGITNFSCSDKKDGASEGKIVSAEEFTLKHVSRQLDSLYKNYPDSFYVLMQRLGANIQNYVDTAGLWDCGEFSSSAYKIQVPVRPGAKKQAGR